VIVSDDGSVVMINQNEWESIKETLCLLNDETSIKALLQGHRDRQHNRVIKAKTIQEAFYDV
jgi:PHD/YefM family antitoxin component YafN of YafNO toxin-antitoxin module